MVWPTLLAPRDAASSDGDGDGDGRQDTMTAKGGTTPLHDYMRLHAQNLDVTWDSATLSDPSHRFAAMSMIWESVRSSRTLTIKRARVSTGWLIASPYDGDRPGDVTYYHDPKHDWDGALLDL